ncbi:hypothetical protein IFM89_032458 [Coptis chinensis]|uniref:Uncharacterized protein n=1 Tax=Coptis chinensis TaxID=261450 RepID=A0A835I8Z3_9MAGN|nr:hypothetical protein IFM89_032458 [Coptis chinensis]
MFYKEIQKPGGSLKLIPLQSCNRLQIVSNEDHLLAEGSFGYVFKSGFPDAQILAVKNINTVVALSIHEEEQFLDVI